MITLYFTATGNSLYAAKKIGGTLVSIPQAIKENRFAFRDDAIVVVCPLYANSLPRIVDEFLNKADLRAEYKALVLTFGHSHFGADGLARRTYARLNFDYVKMLLCVDNYLPVFDVKKESLLEKHTDENLSIISRDIAEHVVYKPKFRLKDRVRNYFVQQYFGKRKDLLDGSHIEITAACKGCGVCTKVCPRGNLYVENHAAKRRSDKCEFCLSCANLCPEKAIICSGGEANPHERFINPAVSVQEIIKSNEQ